MKTNLTEWNDLFNQTFESLNTIFDSCQNVHELNVVKNELIGKNSQLRKLFSHLSLEDKKNESVNLNKIKLKLKEIFDIYFSKLTRFQETEMKSLDIPVYLGIQEKKSSIYTNIGKEQPQMFWPLGSFHPLSLLIDKAHSFFQNYGFEFRLSPEIEEVNFNFDLLNISLNHPSRQKKDSFYLDSKTVLRTHTTNMTVHLLREYSQTKKTVLAYTIGNVYRNDTNDKTHINRFLQLDVSVVGKDFSLANMKWLLRQFLVFLLGTKIEIRFRTNCFPFTEPSLEVDIKKNQSSSWTEILGGGIIRPAVLKACGINENLSVIAFGIGLDRIAMLKYNIDDIRDLYRNNLTVKI